MIDSLKIKFTFFNINTMINLRHKIIRKVFSILILLCIAYSILNAQTETANSIFGKELFAPRTPTVAALQQHIDMPSVESNGLVPININLWTIDEGDIHIPITLSYHGSGIKVDQLAGNVGLGWSLQAGGIISRDIKGLPDDMVLPRRLHSLHTTLHYTLRYYGWLSKYSPKNALNQSTFPQISDNCFWNSAPFEFSPDKHAAEEFIRKLQGKIYMNPTPDGSLCWWEGEVPGPLKTGFDSEPDIFSISAPGLSEKFVFDSEAKPRLLYSNNQLVIDTVWEADSSLGWWNNDVYNIIEGAKRMSAFRVLDANGVEYIFDEKIESMSRKHYKIYDHGDLWIDGIFTEDIYNSPYIDTTTNINGWLLSEINYPNGQTVSFEYQTFTIEREERITEFDRRKFSEILIGEAYQQQELAILEDGGVVKLIIRDKTKYLKKITTNSTEVLFSYTVPREDELKMDNGIGAFLLSSVEIKALSVQGSKTIKEYKLGYETVTSQQPADINEKKCKRHFLDKIEIYGSNNLKNSDYLFDYNITKLPYRGSSEQDHWGYYNANEAQSLIPKIYVYPAMDEEHRFRNYQCNTICGTEYILEGADRSVDESVIQAGVLTQITYPTGGKVAYEYEPNTYYDPYYGGNISAGGLRISNVTHYGLDGSTIQRERDYYYYNDNNNSSGVLINKPSYAKSTSYAPKQPPIYHDSEGYYVIPYSHGGQRDIWLYNGDIVSEVEYGVPPFSLVDLGWSTQQIIDTFTIRQSNSMSIMQDFDGKSIAYTRVKTQDKGVETDNGFEVREYFAPKNYKNSDYTTSVSTSISMQGGWPQVVTNYDNSNGEQCTYGCYEHDYIRGGSEYVYCGCYDGHLIWGDIAPEGKNIYPYPPLSDSYNLTNGQLKNEVIFKNNGDTLIKRVFSYELDSEDLIPVYGFTYKIQEAFCLRYYARHQGHITPHAWARYRYLSNQGLKLKDVKEYTYYSNNEEEAVLEQKSYKYNSLDQLSEVSFMNSDNSVQTTKYKYPPDYPIPYQQDLTVEFSGVENNFSGPIFIIDESQTVVVTVSTFNLTPNDGGTASIDLDITKNGNPFTTLIVRSVQDYTLHFEPGTYEVSLGTDLPLGYELSIHGHINYKNEINYAVIADDQSEALVTMNRKNIISKPVEILEFKNSSLTSGKLRLNKINDNTLQIEEWEVIPHKAKDLNLTHPLSTTADNFFSESNVTKDTDGRITSVDFEYNANYEDVTIIDKYEKGNLLQYHKANDHPVSYLWGYNNSLPIAKVINAKHDEISYCGFEENGIYDGWNFLIGSYSVFNQGYTGKKCLWMDECSIYKSGLDQNKKYTVTFWAKEDGGPTTIQVNGKQISIPDNTNFVFYEIHLSAGTTSITISNQDEVLIDDLRVYPSDAQMTTYTHDPLIGVTSETGPDGISTIHYEYDDFGRLEYIRNQDGNILQHYDYNYAQ